MVDSPELLEFSKLVGENFGNAILKNRKNLIHSLKKAHHPSQKKGYIMKLIENVTFSNVAARLIRTSKNSDRVMIIVPKELILEKLKKRGIVDKSYSPMSCAQFTFQSELDIIGWHSDIARSLLSFYCCANNFDEIKKTVTWQFKILITCYLWS